MRPVPILFRALLALALSLNVGDALRDYQFVLNFQNATTSGESSASSWVSYWYKELYDVWINCDFYDAGHWGVRGLESGDGTKGQPVEGASMLRGRGGGRNLQISCPDSCSSKGTTKCRSIGCAFCGRCDRSRDLQTTDETTNATTNTTSTRLTPEVALKIEKWANSYIKRFCNGRRGCLIYAKIYRVLDDGTSYALTGNTIAV